MKRAITTVLVINDHAAVQGGADRVAIDSAVCAAKCGCSVIFFAGGGPVCPDLLIDNIRVENLDEPDIVKQPKLVGAVKGLYNLRAKKELGLLLNELKQATTVVHIHSWTHVLSSSIFPVLHEKKFKCLITVHDYFMACANGAFYDYTKSCACDCFYGKRNCLKVECDKRSVLQKRYRLARQWYTLHALKRLRPNIAFVSRFQRDILESRLAFKSHHWVLENPIRVVSKLPSDSCVKEYECLFVGRIDKEKGADLFCQAVSANSCKGIVVGEGPMREHLEDNYTDIEFTGWLSLDSMAPIASKSSVFVFTSLLFECSPLVVREMQYNFGLPCIVPEECAARDFIVDGINGFFYQSGDFASLRSAIRKALDPCTLDFLTSNSKKLVKADGYGRYKQDLIKIYNEILELR